MAGVGEEVGALGGGVRTGGAVVPGGLVRRKGSRTMQEEGYKACLRCGKLVPAGSSFCTSCGADLKADPVAGLQGAVRPGDFTASGVGAPAFIPAPPAAPAGTAPAAAPYPAYPPPPHYPSPTYFRPYACGYTARQTDNLAVFSLVCALASFVILPLIPAVVAIALGYAARERIRNSGGTLEGGGLAIAGILLGIANMVLSVAVIAAILVHSLGA